MTAVSPFFCNARRQLFTLLVWLLLGLQAMTPLVHAHTQAQPVHGGFHLPEFQPHQIADGAAMAYFDQNDGMAIGVAQGLPHQPLLAAMPQPAVAATPHRILPQPVPPGSAWAQAPPFAVASVPYFSTPPSQAPPLVLL